VYRYFHPAYVLMARRMVTSQAQARLLVVQPETVSDFPHLWPVTLYIRGGPELALVD
jgi:hypothetical protein